MKKFLKILKARLALGDKIFLLGFTILSILTFKISWQWLIVTLIGGGYIYWQVKKNELGR